MYAIRSYYDPRRFAAWIKGLNPGLKKYSLKKDNDTMKQLLEGFTPFKDDDADRYNKNGWWPGLTFGDILDRTAEKYPNKVAFIDT